MVGGPGESAEDVKASIRFARELRPDYVIVTKAQVWPGTYLAEQLGERFRFELLPFEHEVRGIETYDTYQSWQKRFYRSFYLRPGYVASRARTMLSTPRDIAEGFTGLMRYLVAEQRDDFI